MRNCSITRRHRRLAGVFEFLLLMIGAASIAAAQGPSTPFYKDKTIRIVVGFTSGGLYDQYARMLARHMGKYIPGNPNIIVQNMPGAGSLTATNYIYGVAKADGLTLGMPGSGKGTQGAVLGQLPGMIHISCGDIFRKLPKYGELGKEVVHYTSQGALVPDDLTVRIWERYIKILELQELLLPDQHTLVLDGLPRNYAQAQRLDKVLDVIQIFHLVIQDLEKAK